MLNASVRRKTLLLLLVAVLATPLASAAGPIPENPRSVRAESTDWDLLDRLRSFLLGAWTKVGCNIDPNGRLCPVQSLPPESKIGCHIDPDGDPRCTP